MPTSPGSRLGPYQILSLLGAGGMGEVYRANDPRLRRDVAIKVLPADRMADENRRRRFVREARAASALNHPNIVTVHEIDSVDGVDFIVMEYAPGRTLKDVIPRQGMRLEQVLQVAIPIADALASAHAAGIVHCDLKPGNVVVSAEGTVKVLDFGLARLVTPQEAIPKESATETYDGPGTIVGTVGYMSPEQASGGAIDARSDVFSFGALLYEMVTGRRAFAGNSTAEILAGLLKDQPKPPGELVPRLPKELDWLIQRCLRKDPERRLQNLRDAKLELEQIQEEAYPRRVPRAGRWKRLPWIVAGLATIVVLATATQLWRRFRDGVPLAPPRLSPLSALRGDEASASFSPDGNQVAFTWNGEKLDNYDIYVKLIGSSEMHRLTTDPAEEILPSWSPDGRQIAFVRLGSDGLRTYLISPVGGSARKLADFPVGFATPSWSPDGRWLAVARDPVTGPRTTGIVTDGLYLLPVNGGEPRRLTIPREAGNVSSPSFSPDGRQLAYFACIGFSCHIAVVDLGPDSLPTGVPRRVTRRPAWAEDGYAWTRDGKSILYANWGIHRLWRVDVAGDRAAEPVEITGLGAIRPDVAAAHDRLVFVKQQFDFDIYRFRVGRPDAPAVASSFFDENPDFSPDGRSVAFASQSSGDQEIWIAEADGSHPRQLTHQPGLFQGWPRWSPDGRRIAFDSQAEDGHSDVWAIDADGSSPRRMTQNTHDAHVPSWSRDGRFIYFASRPRGVASQGFDVWRVPASAGGAGERITHGGGFAAYESIDGRTLYFSRHFDRPSPLVALPLAGGPEREVAPCVLAFAVGPLGLYCVECSQGPQMPLYLRDPVTGRGRLLGRLDLGFPYFAVSPDGTTFLYTKRVGEGSDLMLVDNFR